MKPLTNTAHSCLDFVVSVTYLPWLEPDDFEPATISEESTRTDAPANRGC